MMDAPNFYYERDEVISKVTKETDVIANCCEIYFENLTAQDVYVNDHLVASNEVYAVDPKNVLAVNKKKYRISSKRSAPLAAPGIPVPIHPTIRVQVTKVYYYIQNKPLTRDTYNL